MTDSLCVVGAFRRSARAKPRNGYRFARASWIRLIRLRRSMASLNSGQNWADSVLKRAWRARPRLRSLAGASRFVRDSTAREPIKRAEPTPILYGR